MSFPPLSRPLQIASVPAEGLVVEVVADEAERAALTAFNEVKSIERLVARLDVRHAGHDGLSVTGTLEALATRLCVVTLEPFVESVKEDVEMRFASEAAAASAAEDDDPPEAIVGGSVDLGSVVAEFFTLGLDPHPRKPGATFDLADAAGDAEASPFAALRGLTPRAGDAD